MKKLVRKYGNSIVIKLSPEELKIYDIEEGDLIDFSDLIVIKKSKKKK